MLQLSVVNTRLPGETIPSPLSLEAKAIVTLAAGRLASTTANRAAPPASVVTSGDIGTTAMPAVSSLALVTETSAGSKPAYVGSAVIASPRIMVYGTSPSSTSSSTPVTVTVCGVRQSAGVNVRLEGEATPSSGLLEETGIVTLSEGADSSTMVKVAVPPASLVLNCEVGLTVMPERSAPPPRDCMPPIPGIVMLRTSAPDRS